MGANREELLGRMDAAWTEFGARADQVPRAAWAEITAAGWTFQSMLAHVAAWHDATAFRLHRFAATGRPQPKVEPDDDQFNARVAAESVDRTPEQVRRALHTSYERLRAAVAGLPVELDPDGWIEAVVAGNSYGHYVEHRAEVDALLPA
jgi:Mycothiol maleylpyruvate isomerase N-terminal domain